MTTSTTPGSPSAEAAGDDVAGDSAPVAPATTDEPEPDHNGAASGGVLVIGGAGFLGSHLVDRLIAEGEVVDVADDLSTGSLGNLADARSAVAAGVTSQLRIHTGGTETLGDLIAIRRPREIYHLALLPRAASPTVLGQSFTSTLAVLEAARRNGVGKVIVALPASALYGHPAARDLPVREGPFVARGVRGVVAKAIVDLLASYREAHGIEFTALAIANAYGPRQRAEAGVVATLVAAAQAGKAPTLTGDGRQSRDFVFIDDVVDALVRSGRRGSGLVVNVGTGVPTTLRELWAAIAPDGPEPATAPARPDELTRFAISPVRARIHLAWAPWTTLEEGLSALR